MKRDEKKEKPYEVVIEPTRGWLYMDWAGLAHYRDLLFLLVRRDFLSRYKQTILGPAWFILQPLLTTVVFTVVFGRIARISTEGVPPLLFYLCGLLAWSYFSQCLQSIASSLQANANLFSKVYFPRLIVPLSVILSNLMAFMLQLITFLVFYSYYKLATPAGNSFDFNRAVLLLPLLVLETAAIAFGVGLWIASLTVRYRDFQHLVPFMVQLWMYLTPIIFPVSAVPQKWQLLVYLNPMTPIVESYRFAFFGSGFVSPSLLLCSTALVMVILFSGLIAFNNIEKTFVDTI